MNAIPSTENELAAITPERFVAEQLRSSISTVQSNEAVV